jgi:hypothetical protein
LTGADFLKRFWGAALSLLALVGGYFGLNQADLGWVIFPIAGAAVLFALARPTWDTYKKLRHYPTLVERMKSAEGERSEYVTEAANLREHAERQLQAGRQEGRNEVLGAILATGASPPEIIAMSMEGEQVVLIASHDPDAPLKKGARFEVQLIATQEVKGVVEVDEVNADAGVVRLLCVRRSVGPFWDAMERRAVEEATLPDGYTLVPTRYSVPPTNQIAARMDLDG